MVKWTHPGVDRSRSEGSDNGSDFARRGASRRRRRAGLRWFVAILGLTGCVERDLTLPTAEEVSEAYEYAGDLSAEMSGNVAVITVTQPARQLRRGGSLWVKTGPYFVLFSEQTRDLFSAYGGLAAVRVITATESGQEVARATLLRTSLNELTWKRALNIAGHARIEGTERPTRIEDLIDWGEDHTEFSYDPRYIR